MSPSFHRHNLLFLKESMPNYELYSLCRKISLYRVLCSHYTPISFKHIMMIAAMGFILCLVILAVEETFS